MSVSLTPQAPLSFSPIGNLHYVSMFNVNFGAACQEDDHEMVKAALNVQIVLFDFFFL